MDCRRADLWYAFDPIESAQTMRLLGMRWTRAYYDCINEGRDVCYLYP